MIYANKIERKKYPIEVDFLPQFLLLLSMWLTNKFKGPLVANTGPKLKRGKKKTCIIFLLLDFHHGLYGHEKEFGWAGKEEEPKWDIPKVWQESWWEDLCSRFGEGLFCLVNQPLSALSQEMEEELNLKVDSNEFHLLKSLSNDDGQVN